VRSETCFRSRYETIFGGSSPIELAESAVFADALETVLGECEVPALDLLPKPRNLCRAPRFSVDSLRLVKKRSA
jgi:hypothetical protein